ncbi:2OG-Fe(II) oxygenase [Pedobacter sp. KR3-3]|uniref:2OG-Fe(II) oxygenase n=1 Tax=Pedobacter albus TaxID=3113905 RepID=A0ABU7I3Y5_9SPHI|nr:2OG-Fe(II) oxygenase [Pedobacter sp. KR3-3]MEE1944036.1 2OG-Fe(II) oxygenase [Pedobacter sp. KR3-3]
MMDLQEKLASINVMKLAEDMNERGYALMPNLLPAQLCADLIALYPEQAHYRKTVVMERYRFGLGEYKYFGYPLPETIQTIRTHFYQLLAPIANAWMRALNIDTHYPDRHEDFLSICHENGQQKATVLILKYGKGGFNTLHQDLYGDTFFPIQILLFLNEPEQDYTGGEFVLTQQNLRAQSKAIVLKPKRGDVLAFTTNFRPTKGTRGYYRTAMRHGVSEVHSGERHTLGIIFHDATT